MIIKNIYSHKNGEKYINENHKSEYDEIVDAVNSVDISKVLSKVTHEKTKSPLLFSPIELNHQLKNYLSTLGWTEKNNSKKGFIEPRITFENEKGFREMDGLKNKVGLEIQFGKYAFMAYDIFSKMPIFHKRGLIDCGIELVLSHNMIKDFSTGVGSFSQIVLDMKERGVADLDIPTLVIGIECSDDEWSLVKDLRNNFKINKNIKNVNLKGNRPGPKK
tara:strand:+ start:581 stop:1237 length:657 start_codon:yes stop_codon:yes gene_type:complete